jgi:hypothetical protein
LFIDGQVSEDRNLCAGLLSSGQSCRGKELPGRKVGGTDITLISENNPVKIVFRAFVIGSR